MCPKHTYIMANSVDLQSDLSMHCCPELSVRKLMIITAGLSLGGDLGEKVSLNWLTSPCFELREKFNCIEHTGKSKIMARTSS